MTPALPLDPQNNFEARVKSLVLNTLISSHTKRSYSHSLDLFFTWFRSHQPLNFTKTAVIDFIASLPPDLSSATINRHITVVKLLAREASDAELLPQHVAAAIGRVKGRKKLGKRLGSWLTIDQAEQILTLPDPEKLSGARDMVILGVLIGCGLRRDELAHITPAHIQQREGRWLIVDIVGKHNHMRSVPMPLWCKELIDDYGDKLRTALCYYENSDESLLYSINKGGRPKAGMTAQSIFYVVKGYAAKLGVELAPHDLRRTFARLAYNGKSDIREIKESLGHASILTTELYLGKQQSITDAPCDHLGMVVSRRRSALATAIATEPETQSGRSGEPETTA